MSLCVLPSEIYYFYTGIIGQTFASAIMSRNRYSHIKAYLLVANRTPEQNAEDKLAKTRPILDMVHSINVKYCKVGRGIGLDDLHSCWGSSYSRCSHRGEANNPIS